MKLLKDVWLYAIKVDYFMYNSETDSEYTQPVYLSIDTETKKKDGTPLNLIIFEEEITDHLRVFDTEREAKKYMKEKCSDSCCFENPRVIKSKYNSEKNTWEEC